MNLFTSATGDSCHYHRSKIMFKETWVFLPSYNW